ncbi:MAG: molybdopterin molybdotransferase MoeA [Epsilonproteobacteria bacterium]|nr:molybdopterin molybdotransferase MoeA [Campylobacterota bacterium]
MKVTRDKAKEIILNSTKQKGFETVTLEEAYERVLYEDIKAPFNIPESDKSAVDGYAINTQNLTFPAKLKIEDEAPAGKAQKELKNGAIAVMTGAIVPKGADAVVRIEDVKIQNGYIIIDNEVKKGDLINFEGEEIKKDTIILKKGTPLDYKKVALLANMGIYQLKVFQKVKVGIIVTGSEIKEPFEEIKKAGVKNSNLYILKGMLKNCLVTYYGKVEDNQEKLKEVFLAALKDNDVVISSGGASKGKYDFTKTVAKDLGIDIKFTTTNIRPGRPLIFGTKEDKLFFGLPGYPTALLINAVEFLLPAIIQMSGKEYKEETIKATLTKKVKAKTNRVDFIRGELEFKDTPVFTPAPSQQTSHFLSTAFSNALAIINENEGSKEKGERVEVKII